MKLSRVLLHLALVLLLAGCGCGGNEDAVRAMRALPKERLAALYQYVQSVDSSRKGSGPITMSFPKDPVPKEISDLDPKFLEVWGDMSRMHISGCVDDKIYLFFHGLDSPKSKKQIILTLGEWNGSETLWEQ